MKTIRQHKTRFTTINLVEVGEDKLYTLNVISTKTGKTSSTKILMDYGMEAEWKYKVAARFLNDHPQTLPSDFSFYGAEQYMASIHEEQRIKHNISWGLYLDTMNELGLDWEEMSMNEFPEHKEASEAEYDMAETWAKELGFRNDAKFEYRHFV